MHTALHSRQHIGLDEVTTISLVSAGNNTLVRPSDNLERGFPLSPYSCIHACRQSCRKRNRSKHAMQQIAINKIFPDDPRPLGDSSHAILSCKDNKRVTPTICLHNYRLFLSPSPSYQTEYQIPAVSFSIRFSTPSNPSISQIYCLLMSQIHCQSL